MNVNRVYKGLNYFRVFIQLEIPANVKKLYCQTVSEVRSFLNMTGSAYDILDTKNTHERTKDNILNYWNLN